MAKVGLTKLGLSVNKEVKIVDWNNQKIEVKQYLPVSEKLALASNIVNESVDDNGFYNPGRIDVFTTLEILNAYTNINITDKQAEDPCKLYDIFKNKLLQIIYENIPDSEIDYIKNIVQETIVSIYSYKNSILGILERASEDYDNLSFDANQIKEQIGNKENVEFLKNVLDKMG